MSSLWVLSGMCGRFSCRRGEKRCASFSSGAHYIWCVDWLQDTTGSVPLTRPSKSETACFSGHGPGLWTRRERMAHHGDGGGNHAAARDAAGFCAAGRMRSGVASMCICTKNICLDRPLQCWAQHGCGPLTGLPAAPCLSLCPSSYLSPWPFSRGAARVASGKRSIGQPSACCTPGQSKPAPGSCLRPGAMCSWPARWAIG